MTRRPPRIEKLVRLNQFREDIAGGELRQAVVDQEQARLERDSARDQLDALASWKSRSGPDGGLDLSLYAAVLEVEHQAMAVTAKAETKLSESERRSDDARHRLANAASSTRASENRQRRQSAEYQVEREKRSFDQTSDAWLNSREPRRD